MDLTATTGVDPKLVFKLGPAWSWCETALHGWTNDPMSGATPVVFELTTMSTECKAQLNDVKGVFVFFNEGTHTIDNLAAY